MENLEQTIEDSRLRRVKNFWSRGIVGAGLLGLLIGCSCGEDETTAPKILVSKNDVLETETYQSDSKTFPEINSVNVLDVSETEKEKYQDSEQVKDIFGIETNVYLDAQKETAIHPEVTKEAEVYSDIPNCIDIDGDGYGIGCALGFDCDDNNSAVHKMIKCKYDGNSCTQGRWYEFFCVEECPTPPAELCDNLDNNCDGKIDENLEKNVSCGYNNNGTQKQACTNGNYVISGSCKDPDVCENEEKQEQECGSPDVGECQKGTQYKTCIGGQWNSWSNCSGSIDATNEICDNKDNNCNGSIDENLIQTCFSACGIGIETCVGGAWKNCSVPQPSAEICDEKDNNCDGTVDEECVICWDKTFGGNDDDEAYSIQQTTDLGYIVAGLTKLINTSISDAWLFKLDSTGNKVWDKTFGGSAADAVKFIQQTNDGGYIAAGWTYSKGAGENDGWVLKLDSNGEIEWDKTFGEITYDGIIQILPTKDGGYIAAGSTYPKGVGNNNAWVLKLDSNGEIEWDKNFGGINPDSASSIQQTNDDGHIIAGYTSSKSVGNYDGWVFKLDSTGNLKWDKTFGGIDSDWLKSIHQTTEGGYIVAGEKNVSSSDTDDMGNSYIHGDAWILKLDATGNSEWESTFGKFDSLDNIANVVQQTSDGGYITAGKAPSKDLGGNWDAYDPEILYDAWVLKLDSTGNSEWDKAFGKSYFADEAYSIVQTNDGGYVVAGRTKSKGAGGYDGWVLKLDEKGNLCE